MDLCLSTRWALAQAQILYIVHWYCSSRSHCSAIGEFRSAKERKRKRGVMGFVMEFAENLILRLMEDPKERDRKFREHLYTMKDRCNKTKEMWSLPLRPYGFWNFDRHNAQLFWDPQISQAPGRRDPYDDLLQDAYGGSTSSSSSKKN
ncbi:hypothetical protein HYC85_021103 [Camellia sinensis]|uniref:Uncharacterized protein n=2 Tax=Camellia sinensis TaxID=4442 RepID=A0A7J7GKJ1_CAMSI|nr:hypothetical protein HYC85_021103 [Camellia sinensis]